MTKRLALIGASGHGKAIADIAKANGYEAIVFYDDRWQEIRELYGYPVVGDVAQALVDKDCFDAVYIAIGNSKTRGWIQQHQPKIGPALIHPSAVVSQSATLDSGTVVMPNAVINADTQIGRGVIINSGAIVEHDCIIGDFSHICPNVSIAGGVSVGEKSWVGIGSTIIQLCKIGSNVVVGAGAVVIEDIEDNQTVVGNPAKSLKR